MRKLWCSLIALAIALPAAGQSAVGPTLSLGDALSLAKANNPTYLQSNNGRRRADANLRVARGNFLPGASTNFGANYRQGKQSFFEGVAFGVKDDQPRSTVETSQLKIQSPSGESLCHSQCSLSVRRGRRHRGRQEVG